MQCPNDQSVLIMSERKGVEIDYCPTCRGVWLDRGELDKIIDRSVDAEIAAETGTSPAAATSPGPPPSTPYPAQTSGYDDRRYDDRRYDERRPDDRRYGDRRYDDRRYDDAYRKRKKKESWIGEIFDF
jgi:Zn-finger nucleic acid-binding protein